MARIWESKSDTFTSTGYGEHNGKRVRFDLTLTMEHDADHGAPWEEEDGHGPVSDWTRRDKEPGELVLSEHRGSRRYYDFAEACRIARKEGWDAKPYNTDGRETAKQQAAKAARADFEHLRRWANDEWGYKVLCVTASKDGTELGTAYLGGVGYDWSEPDADSYVLECADDMAPEAIDEAVSQLERLCECEAA